MMDRVVKWYFLFNKRLLKRYSFWMIFFLAPFLVWGINILSQEESGIVRIALCMQNPDDELAARVVNKLTGSERALVYRLCETEEEARRMVVDYEVDTAWIFLEDFSEDLQRAAANKRCEPVVVVVEREDNVPLRLVRQILVSKIFSDFSYLVYSDFVRNDVGLSEVSNAGLKEAYEMKYVEGSLFQMEYLDGQKEESDYSYLLSPIRGLLSVWLVLCGLAASLYFMQDERREVFSRIAQQRRLWVSFGIHLVVLSDALIILLAACRLSGVFTSWQAEVGRAVLLTGCTLMFCNVARLLCNTPESLGVCIPVLLMGMVVVCPVFFHFRKFKVISYLFPPYYYLKSIHNIHYVYGMVIYSAVLFLICILLFRWRNRGRGC